MKNKIMIKKLIFIIVALFWFLPTMSGCLKTEEEKESGIKTNKNEGIISKYTVDNLVFQNTSLTYEGGTSTLTTEITNSGDENITVGSIEITFFDEDENKIISILGYIGDEIEPEETKILTSSVDKNLMEAINLKYSVVE